MLKIMEKGALTLAEAVARAEENALRAEENAEALLIEHLFASARLLRDLQTLATVSDTLLQRLVIENDLAQLDIIDGQGVLLVSSAGMGAVELAEWRGELKGLEAEGELLFVGEGRVYTAAVVRPGGGAVLAQASSEHLLALRRSSGAGRLIRDFGSGQGVVYVVWQDSLGVLAASHGVTAIGQIAGDDFLEGVLYGNEPAARRVQYEETEVFEKVIPFSPQGEAAGILRIGLSLEDFRAQIQRGRLQFAALVLLLLVLGGVGAGAVTVRQNYALLGEAYVRVQTYSSRILAQMADAVIAIDFAKGRIQVFNEAAARLFGVAESEAIGRPLLEIWDGELVRRVIEDGEELLGQTCDWQAGDGVVRHLSVSAAPVLGAGNEVETVVFIVQDLSDKRALEADLQRRDRLVSMGALASGVAHEVRNPLNAISIIVQRLRREFEPQKDGSEYDKLTAVVGDEVKRVDRIIRQFLQWARPPELKKERVDLGALLERAAQVCEPSAAAKGLRLERDFAQVGEALVDPDQLQQVLLNLLGNAVEATSAGFVRLAARSVEANEVEVIVEDTGVGIAAEDQERIFDLYYTTKAEGAGLGLGLVHRIVSEHGGRLELHSELGEGTRFTLRFPRG